MDEYSRQAVVAMRVYLERGRLALALMKEQRWDEAERMLNLRKAAYHNYMTADFLAHSPEREETLQDLWRDVVIINDHLMEYMESSRDMLAAELAEMRSKREAIGKYHSGIKDNVRFQSSI